MATTHAAFEQANSAKQAVRSPCCSVVPSASRSRLVPSSSILEGRFYTTHRVGQANVEGYLGLPPARQRDEGIVDVQIGAWTLPVFLRRLHGAVYSDVGDAFTPGLQDFKLHTGVGAELRAEVVLGWILPTDLRLGCAHGLENSPFAILDCYAALGGVF